MILGHAWHWDTEKIVIITFAKQIYLEIRQNHAKIYTSDYILDELISLLFRRENIEEASRFIDGIIKSSELGNLSIEKITSERFTKSWLLRKKFQDKPAISFTDLTSMVIMQELEIQHIFTQDEHFLHCGMNFIKVI